MNFFHMQNTCSFSADCSSLASYHFSSVKGHLFLLLQSQLIGLS